MCTISRAGSGSRRRRDPSPDAVEPEEQREREHAGAREAHQRDQQVQPAVPAAHARTTATGTARAGTATRRSRPGTAPRADRGEEQRPPTSPSTASDADRAAAGRARGTRGSPPRARRGRRRPPRRRTGSPTSCARYAYTGMNAHWFSATCPASVSGSVPGSRSPRRTSTTAHPSRARDRRCVAFSPNRDPGPASSAGEEQEAGRDQPGGEYRMPMRSAAGSAAHRRAARRLGVSCPSATPGGLAPRHRSAPPARAPRRGGRGAGRRARS